MGGTVEGVQVRPREASNRQGENRQQVDVEHAERRPIRSFAEQLLDTDCSQAAPHAGNTGEHKPGGVPAFTELRDMKQGMARVAGVTGARRRAGCCWPVAGSGHGVHRPEEDLQSHWEACSRRCCFL